MLVSGDQSHFFDLSLSNEEAIKWIPVMPWQLHLPMQMSVSNRQSVKSQSFELMRKQTFIRHWQVQLSQRVFDAYLPGGGIANESFILWITDGCPRMPRQLYIIL